MATGGDTTLDPSRQSDQLRREGSLANKDRSSSPVATDQHHPQAIPNQHCRPEAKTDQRVMPLTGLSHKRCNWFCSLRVNLGYLVEDIIRPGKAIVKALRAGFQRLVQR